MTQVATLQGAVVATSTVAEEIDFIVAVEDRTMQVLATTPAMLNAMIVVECVEEGVVAIVKVPIVEGATMKAMEDTAKMVNRNHALVQFKKLT